MSKRRVVVTGLGIVSPFGVGVEKFWNSLLEGKSGISTIEHISLEGHTVHIAGEVKDFKPEEYLDPKDARRMDRYNQFAMVAADEAIADSGIVAGENVDPYRYGVIEVLQQAVLIHSKNNMILLRQKARQNAHHSLFL